MLQNLIRGKYQILREIARSNDIVYEALDTTLGRRVAIKILNLPAIVTGAARRERIERFNREARAAGRLSHPNIVAIYDCGEEGGNYFIAMEYLEGQTLRNVIDARGALPVREAVDIASQTLDALAYAHAHHVIHRDIKPENIHIQPGGKVKITDFGIARLTEEPALTQDGQIFGTPSYMSPEQIEGRAIDHRSDIFSLGVVLFEMLTGRKPFTGDSVISLTYSIMNADPLPMAGVPPALEQVVRRALAKNPSLRYSSAEEMRKELLQAEQAPPLFLSSASGFNRIPMAQNSAAPPPAYPPNFVYPSYSALPPNAGYLLSQPNLSAFGPTAQAGNLQLANPGNPRWSWANDPQMQRTPMPSHFSNPFAAPRPQLSFSLPPGVRSFLLAMLAAIAIGVALAVGVIAFLRAYQDYQQKSADQHVQAIVAEGAKAYAQMNYSEAAKQFLRALEAAGNSNLKAEIKTDLAYTYVQLARKAREQGDIKTAEQCYRQALLYVPNYATAHTELSQILRQEGRVQEANIESQAASQSPESAKQPPGFLSLNTTPLPGAAPPTNGTQSPDTFLEQRRQEAQNLISTAKQQIQSGDIYGAERSLESAVEKGAGLPEGAEAQQLLDQLHQMQPDSSSTNMGNFGDGL